MTIIVADKGTMVADGISFAEGLCKPLSEPKIIRILAGSLIGCAGPSGHCHAFKQWASKGMPADNMPKIEGDDFAALHMRSDGSVWLYNSAERCHSVATPATVGYNIACTFVDGAMAAGADAYDAVRLCIEHCVYVGGKIQMERLENQPSELAIEDVNFYSFIG